MKSNINVCHHRSSSESQIRFVKRMKSLNSNVRNYNFLPRQFQIPLISLQKMQKIASQILPILSIKAKNDMEEDLQYKIESKFLNIHSTDVNLEDFNNEGYSGHSSCGDFARFLSGFGVSSNDDINKACYWLSITVLFQLWKAQGCPEMLKAYTSGLQERINLGLFCEY